MVLGFFEKNFTAADIPDQTGRNVIVTGANTGLGYITALELARHGAKVYMLCRTESRAMDAINRIKAEVPGAQLEFIPFDLCSLSSAKQAAEAYLQKESKIHAVIANAGIMATPYELSKDGIELQAHNGFGHFALIKPLIPALKKTAEEPGSHVRLVQVSSMGHNFAAKTRDFASVESVNAGTSVWECYGQSKLSNILLANELQKRLADTNIYSLSLHPGVIATELNRGTVASYPFLKPLVALGNMVMTTPAQGALTQLYAATSLEVEEKNLKGAYLVPTAKIGKKSVLAEDKDGKLGENFWNLAEKLVADKS